MPEKLTPSIIAKKLGISSSTVRRLTSDFADYLSDRATPRPGGTRIYAPADLETMALVVAMRQDGAPEDEIIRVLKSGAIPAKVANAATIPTLPPEPTPAPLPALPDVTALTAAIDRQADVQLAHVEALQIHAQAMDRLADRLVIFAGALLVIVLLAVAAAAGWIG